MASRIGIETYDIKPASDLEQTLGNFNELLNQLDEINSEEGWGFLCCLASLVRELEDHFKYLRDQGAEEEELEEILKVLCHPVLRELGIMPRLGDLVVYTRRRGLISLALGIMLQTHRETKVKELSQKRGA